MYQYIYCNVLYSIMHILLHYYENGLYSKFKKYCWRIQHLGNQSVDDIFQLIKINTLNRITTKFCNNYGVHLQVQHD